LQSSSKNRRAFLLLKIVGFKALKNTDRYNGFRNDEIINSYGKQIKKEEKQI
jgi:hypothetical protein